MRQPEPGDCLQRAMTAIWTEHDGSNEQGWLTFPQVGTLRKLKEGDFPGGPVVKTSPSNAAGAGSIPGRGAKTPHASGPKNRNKTEAIL